MKSLRVAISAAVLAAISAGANMISPPPDSVDKVLIEKSAHRLTLLFKGQPVRTYQVALGRASGPKERQGDNRTPEGVYQIDSRNAHSSFHRALHVSYPNAADQSRARAMGVEPGGDIMIHGIHNGLGWLGPLHRRIDWTKGCIAVTDSEIEEIWSLVGDGTPVEIRP
jgi:murein L,D-transpeptidase YafK